MYQSKKRKDSNTLDRSERVGGLGHFVRYTFKKLIYDIGPEIRMLLYFDCLHLEIWSYRQILDTS